MDVIRGFVCCFCGRDIEESGHDPVVLTVTIADESALGESQELFCHGQCLRNHLKPGTPTLMDAHDSI